MARFGQGLIQGLTQPSFGQGLFNLGGQIAERRREKQQLEAIQNAAAIGNQGVAMAQSGDVSGLNETIKSLQNQLGQPGITIDTAKALQAQIQQLQGLVQGTKEISTNNSVNSALTIDTRLKDEAALRQAMPNLSEAEFQQAVQSLKDNRNQLLSDPRVAEKYNTKAAAVRRAERETADLAHEDYVANNTAALETAIKNNDTAGVQSFITGAGARYADDAQKYVNLITDNIETMQRLEENSIANKLEPNVEMYEKQISQFSEKTQEVLAPLLEKYKETVESGWNKEQQQWNTGGRQTAEAIEKRMQAVINTLGMNDLNSQMGDERIRNRTLDSQIDEQEAILDLQVPTESMMTSARLMAATRFSGREKKAKGRSRMIPDPPTEEEINKIARQMLNDAKTNARSRLQELNAERFPDAEQPEQTSELEQMDDDGGYSTKINGNVTTRSMVKEALATQSEEQVKNRLRKSGASEEQIEALFGGI